MSMERPIVSVEHITYCYPPDEGKAPVPAVDDVTIQVEKGEFVAVLGHNGSGKSTFAKHLNAILLPLVIPPLQSGMDHSHRPRSRSKEA